MTQLDLSNEDQKLIVRNIRKEDVDEIVKLAQLGFGNPAIAFTKKQYLSHIEIFPEGQVCVEYKGKIVGSCSSLIINFDEYGKEHTIDEISGNGYITNHNPNGKNLYGIDVVVHPDYRHMKIGRRLYEARREICKRYNLKSIIFGGRLPNYHKYADKMSVHEYVEQVQKKNIYDPVLTFQLMNGFKVKGILPDYLKHDTESLKYATLMEWENVDYVPKNITYYQHARPVRIAAVQYKLRELTSFADFKTQCEFFVDMSSRRRADFVVFPENFTLQLLSFIDEKVPSKQVRKISQYTEQFIESFSDLAIRHSVNIVAGSQFVVKNGHIYNIGYLFHRNGKIDSQYKLHVTNDEKKWWGIQPGKTLKVFDTDSGKVAILLGYDIQFADVAETAVNEGAEILFTPFSAEDMQGYLRTRYCAQARAVENQVYTVLSGLVGNLPNVHHLNGQYAQSAIFSPADFSFPGKGIVSESEANTETVTIGDVDLVALHRNRKVGTVTPLLDRKQRKFLLAVKKKQDDVKV